jgi:hypothetical protein
MSPYDPKQYPAEADIDRAYHQPPKDGAWKQVTIAHIIERDRRLILGCCGCQREQKVWPQAYAEKHGVPLETPLLALQRRIRCTTCKARIVHIMPEPYSVEHDRLGKPRE